MTNYVVPPEISRTAIGGNFISFSTHYYDANTFGVNCVDIDGNIYPPSEWPHGKDTSKALGVLIYTYDGEVCVAATDEWVHGNYNSKYVMDINQYNSCRIIGWGTYEYGNGVSKINDILTEFGGDYGADTTEWLLDMDGMKNTNIFLKHLYDAQYDFDEYPSGEYEYSDYVCGSPAIEYCKAYYKGCKKVGQWYLPAPGELQLIGNNQAEVNNCLNVMGCNYLGYSGNLIGYLRGCSLTYDKNGGGPCAPYASSLYPNQNFLGVWYNNIVSGNLFNVRPCCKMINIPEPDVYTFRVLYHWSNDTYQKSIAFFAEPGFSLKQWLNDPLYGYRVNNANNFNGGGSVTNMRFSLTSNNTISNARGNYICTSGTTTPIDADYIIKDGDVFDVWAY